MNADSVEVLQRSLCMLGRLLSPLSACSAASHGLSLLSPLSLFIILHLFCISIITFPLVLLLSFCLLCLCSLPHLFSVTFCVITYHILVSFLSFPSCGGPVPVSSLFLSSLTYFPHRSIVSNCLSNFHLGQWLG